MTAPTRRLERRVRADFGADADFVLSSLAALPDELYGKQVPERIQCAVVLVAAGEAAAFADALRLARLDWRDLLVAAELASGDWPARLERLLGHEEG